MIELAEVIRELRAELERARWAGESAELRFELGPVQLELEVALTHEAGGGGKVRFWVVEVGAEGKVASSSTQKVTLTLTPTLVAGGEAAPPQRAGTRETVYVEGGAMSGER